MEGKIMGRRKKLIVSASQLKTWNSCIRKWWFERVKKLPTVPGHALCFGTVFDNVANRWLNADGAGRDEEGNPVELYPPGWYIDEQNMDFIDDSEQGRIKLLIERGIEEGILSRTHGRKIQEKFFRQIVPGVSIVGYIDILLEDLYTIEDNKTTKSKRWALSKKALSEDLQMNIYGAELLFRLLEKDKPLPDRIEFQHNYFTKQDKLEVFKRQVSVKVSEIEKIWNKIELDIINMLSIYKKGEKEYKFKEIPGSEDYSSCNSYGGCPFQGICYRNETYIKYIHKVDKIMEKRKMSLFDEMKKKNLKSTKKTAEVQDTKPTASTPESEVEISASDSAPPWAKKDCIACEGAGFNTKGNPCAICVEDAKKEGRSLPEDVEPEPPKKKGRVKGLAEVLNKKEKTESSPTVKKENNEEHSERKPSLRKTEAASKRGRPPQGVTLCINCVPVYAGSREIVSLDSVFHTVQEEIAKEEKKDSYYAVDQFKRRDMAGMVVHKLISDLGPVFLICSDKDPDMRSLIAAVKPYVTSNGGTILQGMA